MPAARFCTFALSTSGIKDRRAAKRRKSRCLLLHWGCSGPRRVEHLSGSGVARLRGKAGERQLTCRETSLRTCIFWETREGEGRAETESSSCGSGERCGEPAVPFLSLLSRETQSRQEATECACLYFSLSKAVTTHTSLFFS